MRTLSGWLAFAAIVSSPGCAVVYKSELYLFFRPRGFYQLTGTSNTGVTLISDSPDVRRLLTEEGEPYPDRDPRGRKDFLRSMSQLAGITVPGGSYCDLIERSESRCGPSPIYTASYVLVQVTTGPSKGQRGWMCETSARRTFP
jgi:hypothetical protein